MRWGPLRRLAACLVAGVLVSAPDAAEASAWNKDPGEVFLLNRIDYFGASLDTGGRLERIETHVFSEIGATRRLTFGLKAIYGTSWTSEPFGDRAGTGLSVLEASAQGQILKNDREALAVRITVGAPTFEGAGVRPDIVTQGAEIEYRALYGRRFQLAGREATLIAETAFRDRFAGDADQIRFDTLAGWRPSGRVWLLVETFSARSLENAAPGGADFDLYKVQPSIVWRLTDRFALQAGLNHEFASRNVSRGDTAFVGLWSRF